MVVVIVKIPFTVNAKLNAKNFRLHVRRNYSKNGGIALISINSK